MSERRYRSLCKGVSWRMVGTCDTILLSWFFTGTISKALQIGSVEFFTKILLYYLHERAWLLVPWARTATQDAGALVWKEEHRRSIAKGVSWRITGTIDTIIVAFLITGNYASALQIGATEVITKVFLYYLHERVWHRIPLGRLRPSNWETGGGI
ncbi:MAG: DUF2061 domain-containing protein [bacterium]